MTNGFRIVVGFVLAVSALPGRAQTTTGNEQPTDPRNVYLLDMKNRKNLIVERDESGKLKLLPHRLYKRYEPGAPSPGKWVYDLTGDLSEFGVPPRWIVPNSQLRGDWCGGDKDVVYKWFGATQTPALHGWDAWKELHINDNEATGHYTYRVLTNPLTEQDYYVGIHKDGEPSAEYYVKSGDTNLADGHKIANMPPLQRHRGRQTDYYAHAFEDYTHALEIDPKYPHAYTKRSNVLRAQAVEVFHQGGQDYDNKGYIIDDCDRAIELDPKDIRAWANRAYGKLKAKDLAGAISDSTHTIELDPKSEHAFDALEIRSAAKEAKEDLDGAMADASSAIAIAPDDSRKSMAYCNRGGVKMTRKDWDGAIADYTRAIELDPLDDVPYHNRYLARIRTGDMKGADADHEREHEITGQY